MKLARLFVGGSFLLLVVAVLFLQPDRSISDQAGGRSFAGAAPAANDGPSGQVIVSEPVVPVLVGPARDLPPYVLEPTLDREINPRQQPYGPRVEDFIFEGGPDPLLALQEAAPAASDRGFDTPIFNFDGPGYQFLHPPDTNGAVGKDHYIQMINATVVSIYNKYTGALILQFDLGVLGGCSTGIGDPIVLYDHLADRWLLSEFGPGSSLCVFISQTADPTGAYYSYQFPTPNFPDYPKYGVWPDGYYVSTNESSPAAYALNRSTMLTGAPATSQRFTAPDLSGFGFQALTPSDWDGFTPPPAGAPNYFMRHRDTEAHGPSGFPTEDFLEVWAFHVDWTTPANSTFTQVANIATAEFDSNICGLLPFNGIAMPGVPKCAGNSLDPIREVVMFKLQYRNFGSYEVLVGNLVTDASGNDDAGIRWFELRKVGAGAWTLYQEGTYAPDAHSRWMGAIAMDGSGNIAMGYNVSSSTVHPSLRYVGRLAGDPLGTMPQGEYTLIAGAGTNGSNRYGDYSGISVDPIDDCTFWFTGEYNLSNQWSTRIGAFRFDACGSAGFAMSTSPASQDICVGSNANYTVTTFEIGSFSGNVSLAAVNNPGSAVFVPNPVTVPGSSNLTISSAAAGSYTFKVVGTSIVTPTLEFTNTVDLNVLGSAPSAPTLVSPPNGATGVSTSAPLSWNSVASAVDYTVEVASDAAFTNIVYSNTVAGTSDTATGLNVLTQYFWRVRANNACGASANSAVWSFTTGELYCNSTPISIPSSGPGSPYPSNIAIAGSGSSVIDVNVHLVGLSHTWPDDIDILVVGPQGQNLIIMSDAGGSNDLVNVDLIFDDAAASQLPDSSQITAGTYKPTNYGAGDTFPAPAPAPSSATTLSTFDGTNPNGTWSLYVVDDTGSDSGNLAGGWCLEVGTTGAVNTPPTITTAGITTPIDEDDTATLSGTFTDPDAGDTFTLTVDWGDGSAPEVFNYPAGTTSFSESHQYLDDDPTGTPSDVLDVNLLLEDDAGGSDTDMVQVTVNNVDPVVNAGADISVLLGNPAAFNGSFTDVGTLDSHTIEWDFGDGATASGSLTPTHTYTATGVYSVTLTVTDDDTGVGSDSLTVMVVDEYTIYLPVIFLDAPTAQPEAAAPPAEAGLLILPAAVFGLWTRRRRRDD
jgi:subtilisin-like proprotein convertase family protein